MRRRRVCFVTGTRAEFGLMRSTLQAIAARKSLELQIVVTGMHLDRSRGTTIDQIRSTGWKVDEVVRWPARDTSPTQTAIATGAALAGLAGAFERLKTDVVLVVGDRVEAFAAAAGGQVSGRVVAHVHGGDRAQGLIDDSLRHAITKLAHIHFAATNDSAQRVVRMGEDSERVHVVGAPGLDDALKIAWPAKTLATIDSRLKARRFALMSLHPADSDESLEHGRAGSVLEAALASDVDAVIAIYPNNDPGSAGIIRAIDERARHDPRLIVLANAARPVFLGLMRHAAYLIGNSSAGIIECGAVGGVAIDVGPRQSGRLRGTSVTSSGYDLADLRRAIREAGARSRSVDPTYVSGHAGRSIARVLASLKIDRQLLRKVISY